MAGLNSLLADKEQSSTNLPDWYNAATQQSVMGAQQAFNQVPGAAQTVGQLGVNQLSGPANPFGQAQDSLSSIASGAANPWMQATPGGELTPDTSTNMGSLFQSQRDYLQKMLPDIQAAPDAAAIGSGNFGSLRGQTARDTAVGGALAKMNADQFQAAQQAQTQGIQAGSALGNVGSQFGDQALKMAQFQQTAPFAGVMGFNKALGGLTLPTSTTKQMEYSPLGQVGALGKFFDSKSAGSFLDKFGITGSNTGERVANAIGSMIGGGKGATPGGGALPPGAVRMPGGAIQMPTAGGGNVTRFPDGSTNVLQADGTTDMFDANGNPLGDIPSDSDIYGTPDNTYFGDNTDGGNDDSWYTGDQPAAEVEPDYYTDYGGNYGNDDGGYYSGDY